MSLNSMSWSFASAFFRSSTSASARDRTTSFRKLENRLASGRRRALGSTISRRARFGRRSWEREREREGEREGEGDRPRGRRLSSEEERERGLARAFGRSSEEEREGDLARRPSPEREPLESSLSLALLRSRDESTLDFGDRSR
mmetsp:Transcript_27589/g.89128  ORF Transcript_27589/g.89128 Transcript_27589/m.89128 type:complete len:144 (+) Transcript_27589:305-736(+)